MLGQKEGHCLPHFLLNLNGDQRETVDPIIFLIFANIRIEYCEIIVSIHILVTLTVIENN